MWAVATHRDYSRALTVSMAPMIGSGRPGTQKCPRFRHKGEPGALFAEGKRFELLVRGYRTLVFKTSSIGRSDNLP